MAPLTSISRAAQDLYILASPQSPIRSLLVSVARQLTLSVPPGKTPGGRPDKQTVSDTGGDPVLALLGTSASAAPRPTSPGQDIDLRYAALRELAGAGGPAPIDQVLRSLNDMQQQFAKAAAASGSGILSGGADPAIALKIEALRQPQPLARWLTTLAASGSALRAADKR
jgi:type VI secretion system protein ImpL